MISAATLAKLDARNIDYILGVRERATKEIRGVIADPVPFVPLSIAKAAGRGSTDLLVKEVVRTGSGADGKPWRSPLSVLRTLGIALPEQLEIIYRRRHEPRGANELKPLLIRSGLREADFAKRISRTWRRVAPAV